MSFLPSISDGAARSSGRKAAWGVALLVAATVILGAVLPDRRPHPAPPAAGPAAVPGAEAACLEWTDGCTVCRRLPEGPACSLPGIACVSGPTRCLRPGR